MTKQQLDEIKNRLENASRGKFFITRAEDYLNLYKMPLYKGCCGIEDNSSETAICYPDGRLNEHNAILFANAANDIQTLLEHIESLQGQLGEAGMMLCTYQNMGGVERRIRLSNLLKKIGPYLKNYPNVSEVPNS